jgi:hypothetical protein
MSTSPGKQLQLTAKTAPPILMLAASRPNSENTWYCNELVVMGKDDLVDPHHGFTNVRMRIMPTNNFGCHALACREGKLKLPPVSVVAFNDYCQWKIKHSTCWDQTEIAKYLPKRFKPELSNLLMSRRTIRRRRFQRSRHRRERTPVVRSRSLKTAPVQHLPLQLRSTVQIHRGDPTVHVQAGVIWVYRQINW